MVEEKKTEITSDKKTKKKASASENKPGAFKFNFLDVIIVIMVLAIVLLIIFVYSPSRLIGAGGEETALIYTLRISGVSSDYVTSISAGDIITDENGYSLGIVASDVEAEPYVTYEYIKKPDGNGTIVSVKHPDLVNLFITVSANAELNADGYYVDGMRIAVEKEYRIILPGFEAKGVCIAISEEQANEAGAN